MSTSQYFCCVFSQAMLEFGPTLTAVSKQWLSRLEVFFEGNEAAFTEDLLAFASIKRFMLHEPHWKDAWPFSYQLEKVRLNTVLYVW